MEWRPAYMWLSASLEPMCLSASWLCVAERKPCQRYTPGSVSCCGSASPHRKEPQVGHKRLFVQQPQLIRQPVLIDWRVSSQDVIHRCRLGRKIFESWRCSLATFFFIISAIEKSPEFSSHWLSQTISWVNYDVSYKLRMEKSSIQPQPLEAQLKLQRETSLGLFSQPWPRFLTAEGISDSAAVLVTSVEPNKSNLFSIIIDSRRLCREQSDSGSEETHSFYS